MPACLCEGRKVWQMLRRVCLFNKCYGRFKSFLYQTELCVCIAQSQPLLVVSSLLTRWGSLIFPISLIGPRRRQKRREPNNNNSNSIGVSLIQACWSDFLLAWSCRKPNSLGSWTRSQPTSPRASRPSSPPPRSVLLLPPSRCCCPLFGPSDIFFIV